MREWLVKAGLKEESTNLELLFYAAKYHDGLGSIFAMGDLAALASFAFFFFLSQLSFSYLEGFC